MEKILMIILGLILDAIGVIFIYDARIIANRMFKQENQNKRSSDLKVLGFILAIIGTIIIYCVVKWKVEKWKFLLYVVKCFIKDIELIKRKLEEKGHIIELPNCYDNVNAEKNSYLQGEKAHSEFKVRMYKRSEEITKKVDALLTLNFDKEGKKDYIGGATFLELYDAFRNDKKIYLYNDIPKGILYDEILGFSPIVLNGNIDLIK